MSKDQFFFEAGSWTPPVGGGGGGGTPDYNVVVWEGGALTSNNLHVVSGVAELDGAVFISTGTYTSGTLLFTAKFQAVAAQHIGFGVNLSTAPWAIISTHDAANLYFRTFASGAGAETETIIDAGGTNTFASSHTYKIIWGASDVKCYIDNVLKATHVETLSTAMNFMASDFSRNSTLLTVSAISVDGTSIIL